MASIITTLTDCSEHVQRAPRTTRKDAVPQNLWCSNCACTNLAVLWMPDEGNLGSQGRVLVHFMFRLLTGACTKVVLSELEGALTWSQRPLVSALLLLHHQIRLLCLSACQGSWLTWISIAHACAERRAVILSFSSIVSSCFDSL